MNSTPEDKWEVADIVAGGLQAELMRGLLEAQEIQVMLSQEGAGRAYGFSAGPLGEVTILVPSRQLSEAKKILDQYYNN